MERGSSKHSPRLDDDMASEIRGTLQGTVGGRAEEWKMAEPPGEDQPDATLGLGADDLSRFGSYLGRVFPADREALLDSARGFEAPDDVLARLAALPPGTTYLNASEVWEATEAG